MHLCSSNARNHPQGIIMSTEREWKGIWIKAYGGTYQFEPMPPAPYFRTVFEVGDKPAQAIVHLCGLGVHELFVNGVKADDRWYAPPQTQYDCRVSYIDYDVTSLLRPGERNVIVVHLGSGFYNCHNEWRYTVNYYSWRGTPRLICDVELDGKVVECSGVHWRIHPGPAVYDCFHEGEDYDARLEMPEIFTADYNDSSWEKALRTIPPGGVLELTTDEPCRIIQRLRGVEVGRPTPNSRVYDFGVNISGVVEFEVSGNAGDRLDIQYSELLNDEGRADVSTINMGMKRFEKDSYILKGGGPETWHPTLVYHGFQYVEITFSNPENVLDHIDGLFICSDLAERGKFASSSDMLNKVQEITRRGYRCNFVGVPTDCPTREKFGWGGDCKMGMETGWWNFYPRKGIQRLVNILLDTQRPDGCLSTHGPTTMWGFNEITPTSACFEVEFCLQCLEFDGDDKPIAEYYPKIRKATEFFLGMTRDDDLYHLGYGDYCNPILEKMLNGKVSGAAYMLKDPTVMESCDFYDMLHKVAFLARYLGQEADALKYEAKARRVRDAVNKNYYSQETGLYDNNFWASTAVAVNTGVVPEECRQRAIEMLVKEIRKENHRSYVGFRGTKQVLKMLGENGYVDDAFEWMTQTEYPGYGNIVSRGATTLWESWNGKNSRNHIIRGYVSAFMYRFLAGMSPAAPGFRKIRLAPQFPRKLDWVRAEYRTPLGMLRSAWEKRDGKICCQFEIPNGAEAEIVLPGCETQVATGKVEITF